MTLCTADFYICGLFSEVMKADLWISIKKKQFRFFSAGNGLVGTGDFGIALVLAMVFGLDLVNGSGVSGPAARLRAKFKLK